MIQGTCATGGAQPLVFVRRRLRATRAYQAGDAQEWISHCGRYLVRFVRRAYGVAQPPHYQALYRRDQMLDLLGNHRTQQAAEAACQRHADGKSLQEASP